MEALELSFTNPQRNLLQANPFRCKYFRRIEIFTRTVARAPDATFEPRKALLQVKKTIQRKIEEARLRSTLNTKPYVVESTGRGRIKCHADAPDLGCARCRRRLLMRRRRAEDAVARPVTSAVQTVIEKIAA